MFGVGAVTGEVPAQRKRMTLCDNNVGAYLWAFFMEWRHAGFLQ